jgi:hypothetical protein
MGPYLKSYIVIEKKCVPHPHKRTVEVKLQSSALTTQIYINILMLHNVSIKFGTKLIVASCDVFGKIARTGRFYFEKCHTVTYNLFK